MQKKTIINILYGLAIISMIIGIVFQMQDESGNINIYFWLGLLLYAIGALMKNSNKEKE